MITFDASGLVALLNRRDPDYERIKQVLNEERGPYLVPAGILAEITYMVERRLGAPALDLLLADLESGALTFECGESDLPRIQALVSRYAVLPLGYADAAVVACAERSGGRVLTLDARDFGVVAAEGKVTILPE